MQGHIPVALAAILALGASPSADAAPGEPQTKPLEVSRMDVVPGGTLEVAASGFAPAEPLDVYFDSVDAQVVLALSNGGARVEVTVPQDAEPGRHWVTLVGRTSQAAAQGRVRVVPSSGATRPMLGADAGRTGYAREELWPGRDVVGSLEEAWRRTVSILEPGESVPEGGWDNPFGQMATPSAYVDGVLYATWSADVRLAEDQGGGSRSPVGTRGAVYAIDPGQGRVLWSWASERGVVPGLAVHGSTVVVAAGDLVGLDALTGEVRWLTRSEGEPGWLMTNGDRPVVHDDRLFVTAILDRGPDIVSALAPTTGAVLWSRRLKWADTVVAGRAGVFVRGIVGDCRLVALDPADGSTRWVREMTSCAPPLLIGQTLVTDGFESGWPAEITAVDAANGDTRWTWDPSTLPRGLSWEAHPLAAADGVVYVGARAEVCSGEESEFFEGCPFETRMIALSLTDGSLLWQRSSGWGWWATVAAGVVYPSSCDGGFDATDGKRVWAGIDGNSCSEVLVADGTVFQGVVENGEATVRAYRIVSSEPRPDPAALIPDADLPIGGRGATDVDVLDEPPGIETGAIVAIVLIGVSLTVGGSLLLVRRRRSQREPRAA